MMTQHPLNSQQTCAMITVSVSEFNELLRRLEVLERIVIEERRAVLRQELAKIEDSYKLGRTVKRRVR